MPFAGDTLIFYKRELAVYSLPYAITKLKKDIVYNLPYTIIKLKMDIVYNLLYTIIKLKKDIVYNFTIYDNHTKDGFCFLWDEREAKRRNKRYFFCFLKYHICQFLTHAVTKIEINL